MKSKFIKIITFVILLLVANFFLLHKGLWLYQDASYIYKTHEEVLRSLLSQFNIFWQSNYAPGYDVGLFGFNRIVPAIVGFVDYSIFSSGIAQIIYVISGFVIAFVFLLSILRNFFKREK